jgi:hypothetical protein
MKISLSLILIFISLLANAQLSTVLKNSLTKQPVSYANIWILGENIGTTADENSNFTFDNSVKNKRITISCVGFDRREIVFNASSKTIYLKRAGNLLKEVSVTPRLRNKILVVNRLSKNKWKPSFENGGNPWLMGRCFPFREKYEVTPYINQVKFFTRSRVSDAKFGIQLVSINKNGQPKKTLNSQPIYDFAKKRTSFTEIDISDLNIEMPETGIIMAVEWIIVSKNRHECTYFTKGKIPEEVKGVSYSPSFIASKLKSGEAAWSYSRGTLRNDKQIRNPDSKIHNRTVAIELTLSN